MTSIEGKIPFFKKYAYPLAAAGITQLVLLIGIIIIGAAPFGKTSLLSIDLFGQYYPMINEELSFSAGGWSWNGGLGFDTAAQSAYYTGSLFNLLLLPFSGTARIAALDIVITVRISLTALFFGIAAEEMSRKKTPLTVAFSCAYALSSYSLAYIAQIMWADVVMMAPLVICGLFGIVRTGKPWLYIVSLSYAIYSNFYIAFMLCVFTLLIYPLILMSGTEYSKPATTGIFALSSFFAGAVNAFRLFPLAKTLSMTASASGGAGSIGIYHSLGDVVSSMSPLSGLSLEYGHANIYCIAASLFFVLLFAFSKARTGKKLYCLGLCAFMVLSFELNILDFIWHGFHYPNQLPARQSFLLILLVLYMGYEALLRADELGKGEKTAAFVMSSLVFALAVTEGYVWQGISGILITAVAYLILIIPRKSGSGAQKKPDAVILLMTSALVLEVCSVSLFGFYNDIKITYTERYASHEAAEKLMDYYGGDGTSFLRSEMIPCFTFDPGQLYGYKGVTFYSSLMNEKTYTALKNLGYGEYAKNASIIYSSAPVTDMMLSVGMRCMSEGRKCAYGEAIYESDGFEAVPFNYALPVAFAVSDKIASEYEVNNNYGLSLQNEWAKCASGIKNDIYEFLVPEDESLENCYYYGGYLYPESDDGLMRAEKRYKADGNEIYIQCASSSGRFRVEMDGELVYEGSAGRDGIISVGTPEKGTDIVITTEAECKYGIIVYDIKVAVTSEERVKALYERLSGSALVTEEVGNELIKGRIDVKDGEILYASIPYGTGWKLYIDGKEADTFEICGAFTGAYIEKGAHRIEYRYENIYETYGLSVTIFALMGLAVSVAMILIRKKT